MIVQHLSDDDVEKGANKHLHRIGNQIEDAKSIKTFFASFQNSQICISAIMRQIYYHFYFIVILLKMCFALAACKCIFTKIVCDLSILMMRIPSFSNVIFVSNNIDGFSIGVVMHYIASRSQRSFSPYATAIQMFFLVTLFALSHTCRVFFDICW